MGIKPTMVGIQGMIAAAIAEMMMMARFSQSINFIDTSRPKRRKTGKTYPYSSDRQRARYARQNAAGQIRNA